MSQDKTAQAIKAAQDEAIKVEDANEEKAAEDKTMQDDIAAEETAVENEMAAENKAFLDKKALEKAMLDAELANGTTAKPVSSISTESVVLAPSESKTKDDDWTAILKDYHQLPYADQEKSKEGKLVFPSREAVIEFFEKQAKANRSFLLSAIDKAGQKLDFHVYSCGDGKLYHGSRSEIINQLKNHPALAHFENATQALDPVAKHKNDLANLKSKATEPSQEAANEHTPKPRP